MNDNEVLEAWKIIDSMAYVASRYFNENLQITDSFKRFFFNLYNKVSKAIATYTKVVKGLSTYTKRNKDTSLYTKKRRDEGEE